MRSAHAVLWYRETDSDRFRRCSGVVPMPVFSAAHVFSLADNGKCGLGETNSLGTCARERAYLPAISAPTVDHKHRENRLVVGTPRPQALLLPTAGKTAGISEQSCGEERTTVNLHQEVTF